MPVLRRASLPRLMPLVALVAALLVTVLPAGAACDPVEPPPDDAGTLPDELDVAAFCAALHGEVCGGFASCGCTLEGRDFTAETCVTTRAAACEEALGSVAPFLAAGALRFDDPSTAACLAAVRRLAASCAIVDETTLPVACALFLVDEAPLDAACAQEVRPALCAGGEGVCAPAGDGVRCRARPRVGEPCAFGVVCAEGLACGVDGTCGVGDGRPAPAGPGDACTATTDCDRGLVCAGDGTCAAGPARGEPCGGPVCASGDACVRSYDERTCTAPVGAGEACGVDAACAEGLFCDVDTCAPLPGENEGCDPAFGCAAPFQCDADNGRVCVAGPGEGETCLVGSAICAPGLGCSADNLCVPGPGEGEACLLPQNLCAAGLACDFTADGSICAARRGEGAPCGNDAVCADGLFCGPADTCTLHLPTGAACPTGGGCAPVDDCNDLGTGFSCQPRPDAPGEPCLSRCGGDLACSGLGGVCAPALCASP